MTVALAERRPRAAIIDGRQVAAALVTELTARVAAFRTDLGFPPGLAVILVGDDPASAIYVRRKGEQCRAAGIASTTHRLPADTDQAALLALIEQLNRDAAVHGILVQLPLPPQIDAARVIAAIDPDKDVDGFHVVNAGRLAIGDPALLPCTPLGCIRLLRHLGIALRGKRALVVGRSTIVGRPMAQLLLTQDCTVTIAHRYSNDLPALCREADILVVAVGQAGLVRGDWIKPGAVVIDVGINKVQATGDHRKIVGDVVFDEALDIASAITPVPGGVGPMTIACLLENTLHAATLIEGRLGHAGEGEQPTKK